MASSNITWLCASLSTLLKSVCATIGSCVPSCSMPQAVPLSGDLNSRAKAGPILQMTGRQWGEGSNVELGVQAVRTTGPSAFWLVRA